VLKDGYECEEFGKALTHLCYKNEDFSRNIAKLLIKGVSKNEFNKVKHYLDVVTQVFLIRDYL
jgi:flagellar biosynthesis chaperone FliJ